MKLFFRSVFSLIFLGLSFCPAKVDAQNYFIKTQDDFDRFLNLREPYDSLREKDKVSIPCIKNFVLIRTPYNKEFSIRKDSLKDLLDPSQFERLCTFFCEVLIDRDNRLKVTYLSSSGHKTLFNLTEAIKTALNPLSVLEQRRRAAKAVAASSAATVPSPGAPAGSGVGTAVPDVPEPVVPSPFPPGATCYQVLGIDENASKKAIDEAFRAMSLGFMGSSSEFEKIRQAYRSACEIFELNALSKSVGHSGGVDNDSFATWAATFSMTRSLDSPISLKDALGCSMICTEMFLLGDVKILTLRDFSDGFKVTRASRAFIEQLEVRAKSTGGSLCNNFQVTKDYKINLLSRGMSVDVTDLFFPSAASATPS